MATRTVRIIGDELLRKKSREVEEVTDRINELIDDMLETMYKEDGVGIAAPQVGVLRRIVVIDISPKQKNPIILINPEVVLQEGEQITSEGCLSVPEIYGKCVRPEHVVVKARDRNFNEITVDAEGLLAKCIMHEIDHLNGVLFVDIMIEEDKDRTAKKE